MSDNWVIPIIAIICSLLARGWVWLPFHQTILHNNVRIYYLHTQSLREKVTQDLLIYSVFVVHLTAMIKLWYLPPLAVLHVRFSGLYRPLCSHRESWGDSPRFLIYLVTWFSQCNIGPRNPKHMCLFFSYINLSKCS